MCLKTIIEQQARVFALDPILIAAICLVESGLDQYAFRHEPAFYTRYIKGKSREDLGGYWPEAGRHSIADMEERTHRACSWGYMQIMGQVAREQGFKDRPIRDLWEPAINIEFGCKKLARDLIRLRKQQPQVVGELLTRRLLLAYNGGGAEAYPDKVIRNIESGRALQVLN